MQRSTPCWGVPSLSADADDDLLVKAGGGRVRLLSFAVLVALTI